MAGPRPLDTESLEAILQRLPHLTIGVVGDLFLDRYLDLDAALTEPSLETGRDAYQVVSVRSRPGAAGTVINNLVALGVGRICPIAVLGDDGEGYELRQALDRQAAIDPNGLILAPDRRTPTYTKPMLHEKGSPPCELNRLDIKNRRPMSSSLEAQIEKKLADAWPQLDGLVALDQVSEADCGVITARVRGRLADLAAREPDKFVLADSRERIGLFRGLCLKPNRPEALRAAGCPAEGGDAILDRAASQLARQSGRDVFCTDGARGILIASPDGISNAHPRLSRPRPHRHCWRRRQHERRPRRRQGERGHRRDGHRLRQLGGVDHYPAAGHDGHGHASAGSGTLAGSALTR